MLPGYNHNLRIKGVLFHIQTEDKGINNPVVETQVYFQGNVVAVRKSSYAKFKAAQNCNEIVQAIMQEQHKGMMKDLAAGKLRAALPFMAEGDVEEEQTKNMVEDPLDDAPSLGKIHAPHEAAVQTADVSHEMRKMAAEKSLDELILEFLQATENK